MELNLCEEIKKEMNRLEIKESIINFIINNPHFISSYNNNVNLQRTILITLLFSLLMHFNYSIPGDIRIALNSSKNNLDWLTDIKLYILPFIKENEDKFKI